MRRRRRKNARRSRPCCVFIEASFFIRLHQLHDFLFFLDSFGRLMAAVVWIHFYIDIIHTIINCRWERTRLYAIIPYKQTLNSTHYGRVIAKWLLKVIFRIIDQQKMNVFVSLLFVFNLMCLLYKFPVSFHTRHTHKHTHQCCCSLMFAFGKSQLNGLSFRFCLSSSFSL